MSDIAELERRIAAALDRIRVGIEQVQPPSAMVPPAPEEPETPEAPMATPEMPADTGRLAALEAQLAEEKMVNAQLEERVRVLKERQDTKLAELQDINERNKARMVKIDRDLQRLRHVNAELRDLNSQMRAALSDGLAEPHLINKAMMAELDALRAVRAADVAEVDAILDALTPIVEEAR